MEEGKVKRRVIVKPKKQPETPTVPVPPPTTPGEPLIVTDPEELFTCQACGLQLKKWLLYVDQPCDRLCQCCVRCLFTSGSCGACGRQLTQAEKEMVRIYYESFVPEDWPLERILAEQ